MALVLPEPVFATFFASVLLNPQHHAKKKIVRQQPWHPVAGIVWSDKRCDTVFMKTMRKMEAREFLLA